VSAETVDVEQAAAIPELDETQATRHGIELYATSSGRNRKAVTDSQHVENQKASRNKATEKAGFGFSMILLVFFGLVLLLSLAGIALEKGILVVDWLDNDARIALDRDQMENVSRQDPVDNASTQDQVESASKQEQVGSAIGQTQAEIDLLKQDLANMQQQIEEIQDERDAALAKARQEKERREKEKQAALDAANRERDAQAAAALAAHKAQQAAQKAEKLAIKHRLEKQRLAEQQERLKQASQQAESRRNLLEEQRKLLVSEWERLAKEKAKLDKVSPESDSE
jgi:hypothetical protein